ncbi:Glutathione transport system permease protein GsiC [Usitatibacter rugosus]|uniref:Glutathione transport system permease protein GsiC n=1 Tax=Usitatibacter rugosus TaxID=2732067 RepID=A0A6M4GTL4_9PROT|nr:ABC transporter permease [Usitatibacter rugosus]QJR10188.1 Glutathione transport system permease protein GsiC [Usitatibacter rugosus]
MLKAMARRLVLSALVVFLVTVLVFVATEVLPGDALQVSLTADEASQMSDADFAKRRAELGLDRPAVVRYGSWLAHAVTGDFGKTIIGREDVATVIGYPLRNSMLLGLVTALCAIPIALAIGIAAAYWRGRTPDLIASTGAIVGYSIPEFASGNFLVLCFAIWLPIFPAMITAFTRDAPTTLIAASFLPVLTVVIGSIAHLVRLVRAGFIESLNSDYVERARLAGASNLSLVLRHALPASVIPALNSAALYVAGLLSGIIVVEKVFAYPGLGLVLINAVEKREVAVVQAISLIAALVVIGMNLLADAAVMALDPRARSR